MKKLFLVGALALFGAMNAQKNTLLVGGNVGFESIKNEANDAKANNFEFNPTIGYQFHDNWTAGVKLGLGNTKNEFYEFVDIQNLTKVTSKENTFQYGVFGRYTLPLNETFAFFGEMDVMFANSKNTTEYNGKTSTSKGTGFGVMFTPNLFINFKNSFGMNFNIGGLGYSTTKAKGASNSINNFQFGFGKGVTVGVSKNFKL